MHDTFFGTNHKIVYKYQMCIYYLSTVVLNSHTMVYTNLCVGGLYELSFYERSAGRLYELSFYERSAGRLYMPGSVAVTHYYHYPKMPGSVAVTHYYHYPKILGSN
jgi:hypothetical protein